MQAGQVEQTYMHSIGTSSLARAPMINRRIFWDVDFEKIDFDRHIEFVVQRVFDRGDVCDVRECRRYYGDERTLAALIHAKSLSRQTVYFAAAVFGNEVEDYRCFKPRSSI